MRIPLSAPDIDEADIAAVVSVLRTSRLSIGPRMEEFEASVAHYTGVPYGVALASGTAGLHLGLAALGIGEGDEVILPSFTFIAVANAVLYRRATPVFAQIDPRTLNLTAQTVAGAITRRTRAIIAVHTFGCPVDLDPIIDLATAHGLKVIEDACEALGAEYRGRRAGGLGEFGVFGFYPNKPITTGEGGMLVTRNRELAEMVRALRNQGRRPADGWLDHSLLGYNYRLSEINCALGLSQMNRIDKPITTGEGGMLVTRNRELAETVRALRNQGRRSSDGWLDHSLLGYNYRLSEINCALGLSQMSRIDAILAQREERAACYREHLRTVPELTLPVFETEGGRTCWFVFVVRLAERFTVQDRDRIIDYMIARGIGCGRYFAPVHRQPLYASYADPKCDLRVTDETASRTLALPFFNRLTDAEIAEVCLTLREAMETVGQVPDRFT